MSDGWTRWMGDESRGEPLVEPATRNLIVVTNLSRAAGHRPAVAVDRDDLDDLLARVAPRIDVAQVGALAFAQWSDFTPRGISERIPALQALWQARKSGGDAPDGLIAAPATSAKSEVGAAPVDGAALLDDLIGSAGEGAGGTASREDSFDRAIRAIVDAAPSLPRESPERRERIDAELQRRLRLALAHPEFRALEGNWLGLRRLVRQLEAGEALRILVVDASRAALPAALATLPSALPAGERAALVAACFELGTEDADREALSALTRAAASLECPAVANAAPGLVDAACRGELAHDPAWRALQPELGGRIRLVGPRALVRPPYDADSEGADGLAFAPASVSDAAWVGGAIFAAEAFLTKSPRLDWLPMFSAVRDGEKIQVGPAERTLSEREIERATNAGLVVLSSIRGEDALIVHGLG